MELIPLMAQCYGYEVERFTGEDSQVYADLAWRHGMGLVMTRQFTVILSV